MNREMTIKALPTKFKGYTFRSRLEARWAVFFQCAGLDWEYEPEGYDLGDGVYYLPDFKVINKNTGAIRYYEIKPQNITKCKKFDKFKKAVLEVPNNGGCSSVIAKMISGDPYYVFSHILENSTPSNDAPMYFCPRCGDIDERNEISRGERSRASNPSNPDSSEGKSFMHACFECHQQIVNDYYSGFGVFGCSVGLSGRHNTLTEVQDVDCWQYRFVSMFSSLISHCRSYDFVGDMFEGFSKITKVFLSCVDMESAITDRPEDPEEDYITFYIQGFEVFFNGGLEKVTVLNPRGNEVLKDLLSGGFAFSDWFNCLQGTINQELRFYNRLDIGRQKRKENVTEGE